MDVVAHAGAVRRVVVVAIDGDGIADPGDHLAGDLHEMGGGRAELAAASLRIGAGDVEIAQRDVVQAARRGEIAQHPLDHQLGAARSEEHTSELQSLMRSSYAVFCLKKKNT